MRQIGKVISSDREQALIQVIRKSACGGNCDSCGSSCSMGYLISVPNTVDAKAGELVDIDSDTQKVIATAAMFYLIPLILIVIGIIIIKWFLPLQLPDSLTDLIAVGTGLILYLISLFLIHIMSKKQNIKYTIYHK